MKNKSLKLTNPIAVAMRLRYGTTSSVHKDRREKRKNRKSWKKFEDKAY